MKNKDIAPCNNTCINGVLTITGFHMSKYSFQSLVGLRKENKRNTRTGWSDFGEVCQRLQNTKNCNPWVLIHKGYFFHFYLITTLEDNDVLFIMEEESSDLEFPGSENSSSEDEEIRNKIRSLPSTPVTNIKSKSIFIRHLKNIKKDQVTITQKEEVINKINLKAWVMKNYK